MTKAELIKALEEYPDDAEVLLSGIDDDFGGYASVVEVKYREFAHLKDRGEYYPLIYLRDKGTVSRRAIILE
jgi:hypothetical protein